MEVPAKAVAYKSEHQYKLQVAVECFGVKSLWYAPYEFTVVFKSAIASTSVAHDIIYFGDNRDNRIKSTSVKLKDTQFASLFKTIEVTDNGIKIETAETVPGGVGSITTEPITFTFSVEDYYGNVLSYDFSVKVKENK